MPLSNLDYEQLLPADWFGSCEIDFAVEDHRSFYKLQQKLKRGKVISSSTQEDCKFAGNDAVVKTIEFRYRTPRDFDRIIEDLVLLGLGEIQIQSIADDFFNRLAKEMGIKSPVLCR